MAWLMAAAVLATLASASEVGTQEACLYGNRAYSVGFNGCFDHVQLSCDAHDHWALRGSCAGSGLPSGGTSVSDLPDSFEGELCVAGDWYSPEAEGCIGGQYQKCAAGSQWQTVSPVAGHPGCS